MKKTFRISVKKKVKIESKWEIIRVYDICEIGRGRVINKKEIEENFGEFPVYSSQTSNDGIFGFLNTYDFEGEYVTWTTDGIYAGSVFYRNGKFNCTNVCGTLKSKSEKINMQFLSLCLPLYTADYVVKVANPKLMNNVMAGIQIPLPPIDIQQKIVSEIEVLEAKEKNAKEEVEKLKNSIDNLFTTTKKSSLKSLLTEINPSKSEAVKYDEDTNVSFLSMADVSNEGQIINLQTKKLKEVKSGFTFFQENDVLVAKITPCTENGKGALVSKLENNIGFGSTEFFVLRADKKKLLPKILFHFTQSKDFRINAEKEMTGTSGHRRVPKSFIENYKIPLPPLSEQQKIVSEIEKIEAKIKILETEIAEIPKQKEAILKKYL